MFALSVQLAVQMSPEFMSNTFALMYCYHLLRLCCNFNSKEPVEIYNIPQK